jgi:hypothetical protein
VSCKKALDPVIEKKVQDLLVNKNWNMDEITYVEDNTLFYYLRGGQNNTAHFDSNILLFKEDKNGIYIDGNVTYDITWQFVGNDYTKLNYTIYNYYKGAPKQGTNSVINLENVNLSESFFKYAEIYSHDSQKSIISSVKRISQ